MRKIALSLMTVVASGSLAMLPADQGAGPARLLAAPMIPAPIILNEDDNGTTVAVKHGDYMKVILQEPWTGRYGWDVLAIEGDAVKLVGKAMYSPGDTHSPPAPGDMGQPGQACFRLTAVKHGTATVTLICEPPPGIMAPTRMFTVTFEVAE